MHLSHVIPTLRTGGAERILVDLAKGQVETGHRVTVHTLDARTAFAGELREAGVAIVDHEGFGHGPLGALRGSFSLGRALLQDRSDAVVGWLYHGALAVALAAREGQRRYASLHHSSADDAGLKGSTRVVFHALKSLGKRLDGAVYVTAESAESHARLGLGVSASVIPAGIDIQRFGIASDAERRAARAALNLPDDGMVLAHVARIHPDKDQGTLLAAFARLVAERSDVCLALAGAGWNGEDERAAELVSGIPGDRVRLLGEIDGPDAVLAAADAFVLSSRTEALPVSLLEAMATGTVPVVTDVGACAGVVGSDGEVVPPEDPSALAAAMARGLADVTTPRRERLRRRVVEGYSSSAVLDAYQRLLRGTAK